MRNAPEYNRLLKPTPQLYLPEVWGNTEGSPMKKQKQETMSTFSKKQNKPNPCIYFLFQFLHPPSPHRSCCAPAPLTWSSSLTPTPSWETAPSSGKRLSIAPASPRGRRCTESTWSPISCGTWIQTQSTTSVCCWPGLERGAPGRRGRRSWAGPSVQVRSSPGRSEKAVD